MSLTPSLLSLTLPPPLPWECRGDRTNHSLGAKKRLKAAGFLKSGVQVRGTVSVGIRLRIP